MFNNLNPEYVPMDDGSGLGDDFFDEVAPGSEKPTEQGGNEGKPTFEPAYSADDTDPLAKLFEEEGTGAEKTAMDLFLESKGFVDSNIPIVGEDGKASFTSFNELSREDQLDLLNSLGSEQTSEFAVNADEQSWINALREEGISLDDYLSHFEASIREKFEQTATNAYEVDQYGDEELFLLDQKTRFPNLTEEQLAAGLESALQDEEVFKVKAEALRQEYKQYEEEYNASLQAEYEATQQREYEDFSNGMAQVSEQVRELHGFVLDDEDKSSTLSYLLDLDDQGVSQFYKDINDPAKLFEAAWYMKYGKDAFSMLEQAYEGEIAKLRNVKIDTPKVVRQQNNQNNQDTGNVSVFELY